MLPAPSPTERPQQWLARVGQVFACFDQQISGNLSFGVDVSGQRFFVKTPGDPTDDTPMLDHRRRCALLKRACDVQRACTHPALMRAEAVDTAWGPALIYPWFDGSLLYTPRHRDAFATITPGRRADVLTTILEVHAELADAGLVAVDFYDGCLMYDFGRHVLRIIDLDMYRRPFTNRIGRMFGSSRFMAPEETERGARIDKRTTVFTMGRAAAELMAGGSLARAEFVGTDAQHRVIRRACMHDPADRFADVRVMLTQWALAGRVLER